MKKKYLFKQKKKKLLKIKKIIKNKKNNFNFFYQNIISFFVCFINI